MNGLDAILSLFGEILRMAVSWLPRVMYVPRFETVVRWSFGREPVEISGQVFLFIPLFQNSERVDRRVQATEFEPKVLWTKDGREAALGMVVLWRVDRPKLCCETVDQLGLLVAKLGESVLPELVGSLTLDELKRKAAGGEGREWGFDTHLRRALLAAFEPYGITVERARVNFTSDRVRTFKLIGSSNEMANVAWESE
jgi:regulator of protease activity HflC (stomatin/prohibitin superfamily)